jgi:hypothetical protein
VQRIVAAAVQFAGGRRGVFMVAATPHRAAQVLAAMHHGPHEPTGGVDGLVRFSPQRHQSFLHGVEGQVVAAEQASSDRADARQVRLDALLQRDLRTREKARNGIVRFGRTGAGSKEIHDRTDDHALATQPLARERGECVVGPHSANGR